MHAHSLVEFCLCYKALPNFSCFIRVSVQMAVGHWLFRGSLLWVELKAGLGDSCGGCLLTYVQYVLQLVVVAG